MVWDEAWLRAAWIASSQHTARCAFATTRSVALSPGHGGLLSSWEVQQRREEVVCPEVGTQVRPESSRLEQRAKVRDEALSI